MRAEPAGCTDLDDDARAWATLLAARRWEGTAPADEAAFRAGAGARLAAVGPREPGPAIQWSAGGWRHQGTWSAEESAMLDLYLPLCTAHARGDAFTVGHLGQSLDGHIAMDSGDSCFVTGPANITHLHRMRALCDAVVVGAHTVACDDPQLTTRQVPGDHAVRVVLDPGRRLNASHRLFRDGAAPTLVLFEGAGRGRLGEAEAIGVRGREGLLDLEEVLATLHGRGLDVVFVEGGGITVSGMLEAGLLDRLQVTVAPLIIGYGRPGLRVPAPASLEECPRPCARIFRMGADVLFDCDLRASPRGEAAEIIERVL